MVIAPLVFYMKLVPLDSAHIGLSIHAKNSFFLPRVPFLIAGHKLFGACHTLNAVFGSFLVTMQTKKN